MSDDHEAVQPPDPGPPAGRGADRLPSVGLEIVRLPAEIDLGNAGQVQLDLLRAAGPPTALVIADMSRTAFCDCAGISALLRAGALAARQGSELRVVARARPVLRTFELTGLTHQLPVYSSVTAALSDSGGAGARSGANVSWLIHRRRTDAAGSGPRPGQPQCP